VPTGTRRLTCGRLSARLAAPAWLSLVLARMAVDLRSPPARPAQDRLYVRSGHDAGPCLVALNEGDGVFQPVHVPLEILVLHPFVDTAMPYQPASFPVRPEPVEPEATGGQRLSCWVPEESSASTSSARTGWGMNQDGGKNVSPSSGLSLATRHPPRRSCSTTCFSHCSER
jgi:hypothetical protein